MDELKYIIKKSKRKTIELRLIDYNTLLIKCPDFIEESKIEGLIKKKERWIQEKREKIKNRIELNYNEIYFINKIIKKKVIIQPYLKKEFVAIYNDELIINLKKEENYNKVLNSYLKEKCFERVKKYILKYESFFETKIKEINIKKVKSRWGSCTYDNKLMFNMYLALAPDCAVEYVVVHEMCHLIHKNHSSAFYKEIEMLLPSYKEGEEWLKKYGYLIIKPEQ